MAITVVDPIDITHQLRVNADGGIGVTNSADIPGVARQLAAGAASANVALTPSVTRASLLARLADLRFSVGNGPQVATTASHYLAVGTRLDIGLPENPNIAAIRAGATDAVLEITEYNSAFTVLLDLDFTQGALPDGVTLARASTGARYNSAGLMVFEAANAPRFTYNPVTLAARGLLIEPQRTNLALQSESFAGWSINNVAITTNSVVAPTGLTTAALLVENTANSFHRAFIGAAATVGLKYSVSMYAKAKERVFAYLCDYSTSSNYGANFDLTTGEQLGVNYGGSPANPSVSIAPSNNGFFRLSAAQDAAGSPTSIIMSITDSSTPTWSGVEVRYLGDGVSGQYWWGAQTEQGDVTSYIPTTTAAVTRAADIVTIPLPSVCDLLVQDELGGEWRPGVPGGTYTLTPRAGSGYKVKRVRAYSAGFAASNPAMAVAI